MAEGGTYTLLVELAVTSRIEFGAAGARDLRAGWYAYTGSAMGGGFARVCRNRRLAVGESAVRHWHVDSMLGRPDARLDADVRSAGVAAECAIAVRVADAAGPVAGVGATDCTCETHLAYTTVRESLDRAVRRAHERVRGRGRRLR